MATIAIGSSAVTADAGAPATASVPAPVPTPVSEPVSDGAPNSSAMRYRTTAVAVGKSKTRVVGSRSPVAAPSRLRSSTAASESNPSSRKARSAWIDCAPSYLRTSAA